MTISYPRILKNLTEKSYNGLPRPSPIPIPTLKLQLNGNKTGTSKY